MQQVQRREGRKRSRCFPSIYVALVTIAAIAGCSSPSTTAPEPPPEVTVMQPESRDITTYEVFTGTTESPNTVEVRARVFGELREVHFEDGQVVNAGDLLFTIEKEPYEAALNQAKASVQSAEAELKRAESDLARMEQAIKTNSVSQQDVDLARANREKAVAGLAATTAALEQAKLDLSYTDVHAPISGRAGRSEVDIGNLVGMNEPTLLTTIRQVRPIDVEFDVPETNLLRYLRENEIRNLQEEREKAPQISVGSSVDEGFPYAGRITYIDNTADPGTGTILVRARVPNDNLRLLPGVFVRVRVSGDVLPNALVVDERAVAKDLGGAYIFVVGSDNVVERRYVTLGPYQDDGTVVVLEGIEEGESYISEGMIKARPGLPVNPQPPLAPAKAS